jgi:hypothetical protein
MGKSRIIKAISSVVKPPKGGFFVPEIYFPNIVPNIICHFCPPTTGTIFTFRS